MPTLEFEGKAFVHSHHLSVPYRELNPAADKGVGDPDLDGNLIVHGDNLEALKALLPRYAGKIDVIYIDPPYNTGKEKWAYSDNVNSPMMKTWLGEVVGKDDLQRHDKWLCMMWPRLQLLSELLADHGVLFCSIDDNEMHNLRSIMDQIFGSENFLGQVSVLVNPKGRGMKDSDFAKTHEYVVTYQRRARSTQLGERKSQEKILKDYRHVDENGKRYRLLELRNTHEEFGRHNRENLWYPLYAQVVGEDEQGLISLTEKPGYKKILPIWDNGYEGCWTWDEKKAKLDIDQLRSQFVRGRLKVYRKGYSTDDTGEAVQQKIKTIWSETRFFTETGSNELLEVIPDAPDHTPKPVALVEQLMSLVDDDKFTVLDSFAGTGTTGQAVLSLNQKDGGSRKFILIETEDYADTLTAERVRRVIAGVPAANDPALKAGLPGTFTYAELGEPMDTAKFFDAKGPPVWDQVARYVVFTATGETVAPPKAAPEDGFVAEAGNRRVHLLYRPDLDWLRSEKAALTLDRARALRAAAGTTPLLVFGSAQYVASKTLRDLDITFAQLPWSIHQRFEAGK